MENNTGKRFIVAVVIMRGIEKMLLRDKMKEHAKSKDGKVWTYCYSINPDALDFIKHIYESSKLPPKNHSE